MKIEHFGMTFGTTTVIRDLSFEIRRGETFDFLGSNGSGKTTTIRALPRWMAVVDIVVLFALSALVLQIAVRVFKYGSIEYGRKVSLKGALARRADKAGNSDH